jgi:hypothetical protein
VILLKINDSFLENLYHYNEGHNKETMGTESVPN